MASTNFMFKGKQGSIDSHGFISWGGMGFNFESAGEDLKTAISKATGIKSETVPANKAFSNGRQKAQQEIANKFSTPVQNGFGLIGDLRRELTSIASKLGSCTSNSQATPEEKKACAKAETLVDQARKLLFDVDK